MHIIFINRGGRRPTNSGDPRGGAPGAKRLITFLMGSEQCQEDKSVQGRWARARHHRMGARAKNVLLWLVRLSFFSNIRGHYLWSKGCFWYCVFNPWVTNPVFLNNIVNLSQVKARVASLPSPDLLHVYHLLMTTHGCEKICCHVWCCSSAKDIPAAISQCLQKIMMFKKLLSSGLAQLSAAISQCLQKIFMFWIQV